MQTIKQKWLYPLIGIWGALFSQTSFALEVQGLYEVELVVKSQNADDRLFGLKQAFYSVLNRVVVSDNIARQPIIQEMLKNPTPYIKQFQYADLNQKGDETAERFEGPRRMQVEFDEEQILKTLQSSQLALWDENRPATLLWIVVNDQGDRQFYNPEFMSNIEAELNLASRVKGLPFIYPLLDLDEQQRVSVDTMNKLDQKTMIELSQRYEAISTAVVNFTHHDNCWQTSWTLYFDGRKTEWSGMCQPMRLSLLSDVERLYQVLSSFYAVKPSATH